MTETPFFPTTDLCDAHEARLVDGTLQVLPPLYRRWGGQPRFRGPVQTVRCFEDNSLVRTALEGDGAGRVLLVDGGGSLRCALLGGNLAQLAERNGWVGVIVHGCVRDVNEIDACAIGVRALASHPRRSEKRETGSIGEPVDIHGIRIAPGHWCHADEDGVIFSHAALSLPGAA